jgi:hypothetical protein
MADRPDAATRAARAKEQEIRAHERAIAMHELAAQQQAKLGHPDLAAAARTRAAHARHLLALARSEQRSHQQPLRGQPDSTGSTPVDGQPV